MPAQINKDTILKPGTVDELIAEFKRMVASMEAEIARLRTSAKGIFNEMGQGMSVISGTDLQQIQDYQRRITQLETQVKKLTTAREQGKKTLTELERIQQRVSTAQQRATEAYVKEETQLKKLNQERRKAVTEQLKMQGAYKPGFFSGLITNLKSLASTYLSLYAAMRLVSELFTKTLKLDVLAQSYKYLIQDTKQLAEAQRFLSDITARYGLEIISTSNSYLKFRASIQGANFDLDQADKIFKSVAKAGAVLGLSAERMELTFLALEQMISKGTISTEELRRQLGDNLPGAMQIMADALGVTIPELLKMIKANQVLATDALPKFAAQLEKTYNVENVQRIDNMQAAVNRLKNSWTEFVDSLNAEKAGTGILNFLAKILGELTGADTAVASQGSQGASTEMEKINKELDKLKSNAPEYEKALWKVWGNAVNQLGRYSNLLEEVQKMAAQTTDPEKLYNLGQQERYYRVQQEIWQQVSNQLDDMINKGLKVDKPVSAAVMDEQLESLREQLRLASGIVEKLEAEIALNDYLIKQAKSVDEIRQLQTQNALLSDKLAFYTEYIALTKLDPVNRDVKQTGLQRVFFESPEVRGSFMDRLANFVGLNKEYIDAGNEFNQAFSTMMFEFNMIELETAQKEVDIYERRIDELKGFLDEERRLKDEGKANDYDRTVAMIAEQQKLQEDANTKLEKAKRREAQIQLAAQASDIITASANIIEGWTEMNPVVGAILGLAQVAYMIGAFASYKGKIKSMSKYGEGEVDIHGKSHAAGGEAVEIEGGESVINKRSTSKSKRLLQAINEGLITDNDLYRLNFNTDLSYSNRQRYSSVSEMLKELRRGNETNAQVLQEMKNRPAMHELGDGRVLIIWNQFKQQILRP